MPLGTSGSCPSPLGIVTMTSKLTQTVPSTSQVSAGSSFPGTGAFPSTPGAGLGLDAPSGAELLCSLAPETRGRRDPWEEPREERGWELKPWFRSCPKQLPL